MTVILVQPIAGQKAGTSGLRRKTRDWMAPHFLENYVQSTINAIGGAKDKRFIIGGDGRFYNSEAIQVILRMLAANGASGVIVGRNGLLSTPAASHLIRLHKTDGGFILSASHNPGGIDADFGLKFNMSNGGPATEIVSNEIYAQTTALSEYQTVKTYDIDLSNIGHAEVAGMTVQVVDPVSDYSDLMQTLFDFKVIRGLFRSGFRMRFDAMHAVTGPYATMILQNLLGAPSGTVQNSIPLMDFGQGHPDPNPICAHELMSLMMGPEAPDFGAAMDGYGDRNMIVGRGAYVTPSDSLAILAAHAHLAPAYAGGLAGIARSMPTSAAVDRVAAVKGIPIFVTPTGWKFFGNLLDAGKVALCGEESAGTGSDHVREKDGLWAVLMWLNILAETKLSVAELMTQHWTTYGRNYYSRHDFKDIPIDVANALMDDLRSTLPTLTGQSFGGLVVGNADEFSYDDPVDSSKSVGQGLCISFEGGARVVFRLSGTGTQGATLRMYLETLETNLNLLHNDPQKALADVIKAAYEITELPHRLGRHIPDVIT